MHASYTGLLLGLAFAIMLDYLLIVVNFQSWLDPFIMISALPAALAGIAWILFIAHTTLSVPALMGTIMCMGVATANSILVVSFATEQMKEASAADLAVVNLSMQATLAVDYFAARTLDAEDKLLKDTVAQYEEALQLNEDRYGGGLASEVEVEKARTILERTRAQWVDVGGARAQ